MPMGSCCNTDRVHICANGDEKQPQQKALEGFDVTFELMAKLAIGEHNTGQKRAKRR